MKALVVGAAGNIGSALVFELAKRGHEVRALIHRDEQRKKFEGLDVEFVVGDVMDFESIKEIANGVDIVYHLVGYLFAPRLTQIVPMNMAAAKNVAKACLESGVKRIVFTSSVLVYPVDAKLPVSEDHSLEASTEYEKAKIEVEKYLLGLSAEGLNPTIIRVGHVYGLGVTAVEEFKYYIKKGLYFTAGNGNHIIPPVFVGDLANALALAAEKEEAIGQVFNVNDDDPMTLREFSNLIAKELGKKPVKGFPVWLFKTIAVFNEAGSFVANRRPWFDRDTVKLMQAPHWGDNAKAKKILGWQPQYKSFKEGVKLCF